jgi:hypothetical protein
MLCLLPSAPLIVDIPSTSVAQANAKCPDDHRHFCVIIPWSLARNICSESHNPSLDRCEVPRILFIRTLESPSKTLCSCRPSRLFHVKHMQAVGDNRSWPLTSRVAYRQPRMSHLPKFVLKNSCQLSGNTTQGPSGGIVQDRSPALPDNVFSLSGRPATRCSGECATSCCRRMTTPGQLLLAEPWQDSLLLPAGTVA